MDKTITVLMALDKTDKIIEVLRLQLTDKTIEVLMYPGLISSGRLKKTFRFSNSITN